MMTNTSPLTEAPLPITQAMSGPVNHVVRCRALGPLHLAPGKEELWIKYRLHPIAGRTLCGRVWLLAGNPWEATEWCRSCLRSGKDTPWTDKIHRVFQMGY